MSQSDLINADEARKFLELLHSRAAAALSHMRRPGVIQLVSIAPNDRGMSISAFAVGDVDSMLEAALVSARCGKNAYVETRTVRPGRPDERGRGKIESTIGCFALVIDRDRDTGRAGHINGSDTTVVETSPGNSHEWLFLRRALDAGDAKPLGELVRKAAGADHCTGVVTQPYRIPGLGNFPDAKKVARGRVVVPAKLIRVSDRLWTPGEIEAAFSTPEAQPARTQPRRKAAGALNGGAPGRNVRRKIAAKATPDMDRSAQFQSVVNSAARAGLTPDQLELEMRRHPDGCAGKYLKDGDRLRAEIDRSWDKVDLRRDADGDDSRHPDDHHHAARAADHRPGVTNVTPADGAVLLDQVYEFLGRFVAYPNRHAQVAHVLWITHCHLIDRFETTPRLAFISPEPASGKTRALEITELLVPNPVLAVNVSPAYLIRKIAAEDGVTVLFDEIDTVFGNRPKESNEDVRALLNAGYRRGAVSGRVVMQGATAVTEELPSFAPVALAGLGMPPDTILSRSIIVRMQRRAPNERVTPYRRRDHGPEGERLCGQLASWTAAVADHITIPDMPDSIVDRNADCWEALFAVADAAGGHWPDTARVAGVSTVLASRDGGGERHGIRLLADIHKVIGDNKYKLTAVLLRELAEVDESPWADIRGRPLSDVGLANRLRPYGIKPPVGIGAKTSKTHGGATCLPSRKTKTPETPATAPATAGQDALRGWRQ
jgi:Protein of unknown function (DUF3631)